MRLIRFIPGVLVVGSLAAACGGTSDGGGTGNAGGDGAGAETGITVEELPEKYAETVCEVFSSCVGDLWSVFRPGETCIANVQPRAEEDLAPLSDAIKAGRVKYDASKVQGCLDDVKARGCAGFNDREPASCQAALEGTVMLGLDCTLDEECAGDSYCKLGDACPGKCAAYESAGGACVSNDNCKSGLKCDDNGHCVAPGQEGDACDQGEPDCSDGLICLGQDSDNKLPGTCYTIDEAFAGKVGDACSVDGKLCSSELACEITSFMPIAGTCVAKLASGADCKVSFPDECPGDEYCLLDANPLLGGKCTAKPGAGEKCATVLGGGQVCGPYTRCDSGVCRAIAHAGEDCTVNSTCYSERCLNGACVTGSSCE